MRVTTEYRLVARARLDTPLLAGSGEEAELADLGLRRRADGRPIVPGTSIAGALRSAVERLTGERGRCKLVLQPDAPPGAKAPCGCKVCNLFGDARPAAAGARASRVVVLDAPLHGAREEIADGVSIDRARRAAAERRKFDFEQVAAGEVLTIEVRALDLTDEELAWLAAGLRLMGEGRIPLGGRTAQGFGVLRAQRITIRRRDLLNPAHLVASIIHEDDSDEAWPEEVTPVPGQDLAFVDEEEIVFTLRIPPESTLIVADPAESVQTGFDLAPRWAGTAAVLPATSLRGALRSGAERILRTLKPEAACDPFDRDGSCAARERKERERAAREDRDPAFTPCHACRVFGNEERASWLRVRVRPRSAEAQRVPFDHVSIDRFTGGASEGKKFDMLAARGVRYEVRCTLVGVPSQDRDWVVGLLALTLQDLADGRIHVGHGSARGHGQLWIEQPPTVTGLEACVPALWRAVGAPWPAEVAGR